jgi:very-short-patch-repair endonuclease
MRRAQPWRTNRARVLRANETCAEDRMWSRLRGRRFHNLKFLRQCQIGLFFANFACRERKIIVEIDGVTHSTAEELHHDAERAKALQAAGYRIFRISNTAVFENIDGVLPALLMFIEKEGK